MTKVDNDAEADGTGLSPDCIRALRAAIPQWMADSSAALYARWWQIETWLRDLVYLELRAQAGSKWTNLARAAGPRLEQDAAFTHMSGPDSDNPLAYLDYSQLAELIDRNWDQVGYALIERRAWQGRQEELKRIRHRIGHLRRPHDDDLGRLEQTLRDLERGAFIALASFNDRDIPDESIHNDPITDGWVRRNHPVARRLTDHAARQYGTTVRVSYSRRPWVAPPKNLDSQPGIVWDAECIMRDGRVLDLDKLWHYDMFAPVRPHILHIVSNDPSMVRFTFSGADDLSVISDAIGNLFDAILYVSHPDDFDTFDIDDWERRGQSLDYRVKVCGGWDSVTESTLPINLFGAGGGVKSRPIW